MEFYNVLYTVDGSPLVLCERVFAEDKEDARSKAYSYVPTINFIISITEVPTIYYY